MEASRPWRRESDMFLSLLPERSAASRGSACWGAAWTPPGRWGPAGWWTSSGRSSSRWRWGRCAEPTPSACCGAPCSPAPPSGCPAGPGGRQEGGGEVSSWFWAFISFWLNTLQNKELPMTLSLKVHVYTVTGCIPPVNLLLQWHFRHYSMYTVGYFNAEAKSRWLIYSLYLF